MIDIRVITAAMYDRIRDSETLASYTVERSQRINFDPGKCPWIGVYPGTVDTKPHTLGRGVRRWMNNVSVQVVIQTASYVDDGQEASDSLEEIIRSVNVQVDTDLTLGVSDCQVVGMSREYKYIVFDDDGNGSVFMPQAILRFDMEVRGQ